MSKNTGEDPSPLLPPDTYLTRERVAELFSAAGVPTTRRTLEGLAVQGKGPPYRLVCGRAIYPRSGALSWLQSSTAPENTSST